LLKWVVSPLKSVLPHRLLFQVEESVTYPVSPPPLRTPDHPSYSPVPVAFVVYKSLAAGATGFSIWKNIKVYVSAAQTVLLLEVRSMLTVTKFTPSAV
jgi:hypothetical protein